MRSRVGGLALLGIAVAVVWYLPSQGGEPARGHGRGEGPVETVDGSRPFVAGASAPESGASTRPASDTVPPLRDLRRVDPCIVTEVTDGDTLRCAGGVRVRLLLIDTPERDQGDLGAEATRMMLTLVAPGDSLLVAIDVEPRDQYGRLLAHLVTPEGVWLNYEMVNRGYAAVLSYPPNLRYLERFREAARRARVEGRGLWGEGLGVCLPVDYRGGRC